MTIWSCRALKFLLEYEKHWKNMQMLKCLIGSYSAIRGQISPLESRYSLRHIHWYCKKSSNQWLPILFLPVMLLHAATRADPKTTNQHLLMQPINLITDITL